MLRKALTRAAARPAAARPAARFISTLDHETLPNVAHLRGPGGAWVAAPAAPALASLAAAAQSAGSLDAASAVDAFLVAGKGGVSDPAVVGPLYDAVVRHAEALSAEQTARALFGAALLGLSGTRGVVALEKAAARTAGDLTAQSYDLAAKGAYGLRLVRLALGPLKAAAGRLGLPIRGDLQKNVPGQGMLSLWQAIEAHKREQPALSEDQKEVHKESEWTS
jgi:hypothetical protein